MTAPLAAMHDYELYRVILDYEALQDGFLDRIDELDTTMAAIPKFADGVVQKLLTKNPGKAIARKRDHRSASARRSFGWESLGKMLEGTGLALVLVIDDERFAPLKERLAKRRRKPAMAGIVRPTWLFTKDKAREMGKKRFSTMNPAQCKRFQRKAAKSRWRKKRRRACAIARPIVADNLTGQWT